MQRRSRRWVALLFASVLAACGGTVEDSVGPATPPPVDTSGPGAPVARGTLVVRVSVDPKDAALASAVGIGASGQVVRVTRRLGAGPPLTATTDASGEVRFPQLLAGVYDVSVDRPLSAGEVAQLPPGDRDATLFAGAAAIAVVAPGSTAGEVELVAARRGSIVISELYLFTSSGPVYPWANYLEVYNNADTTVYLDGMILFSSSAPIHQGNLNRDPPGTCDRVPAWRMDPDYVWTGMRLRFPGAGTQYPVPPGEGRVIATDALDHNAASPGQQLPDLSRAHFEQMASDADTDNPLAANMIRLSPGTGALGRGTPIGTGFYGIARAIPEASFGSAVLAETQDGVPRYGIPREAILDGIALDATIERIQATAAYAGGIRRCEPYIHPVFDRAVANLANSSRPEAMRRKSLGRTPDGREILQRTRASARDFEWGPPLQRSLQRPQ